MHRFPSGFDPSPVIDQVSCLYHGRAFDRLLRNSCPRCNSPCSGTRSGEPVRDRVHASHILRCHYFAVPFLVQILAGVCFVVPRSLTSFDGAVGLNLPMEISATRLESIEVFDTASDLNIATAIVFTERHVFPDSVGIRENVEGSMRSVVSRALAELCRFDPAGSAAVILDVLQLSKISKRATGWVDQAPSYAATSNSWLMN